MRTQLTSNLILYVKANGGYDNNDGLTEANALATIDKAILIVCNTVDLNGYSVTIQLVADSVNKHTPFTLRNYMDAGVFADVGACTIKGDSAHPELHMVQASNNEAAAALAVGVRTAWVLEGINLSSTCNSHGVEADFGSMLYLRSVSFGNCNCALVALFNSKVEFLVPGPGYPLFTMAGTCSVAILANINATVVCQNNAPVSFLTGNNITLAFIASQGVSQVFYQGSISGTPNNARRVICQQLSLIQGYSMLPNAFQSNIIESNCVVGG